MAILRLENNQSSKEDDFYEISLNSIFYNSEIKNCFCHNF